MRYFTKVSGFALAGLLTITTGAGAGPAMDSGDSYRNIVDRDAFVQDLTDQRTSDALYQNTMSRDAFVQDLVDQRTTGSLYKNVIGHDSFEDQLVDWRVTEAAYRNMQTPESYELALRDNFDAPFRNIFSTERFLLVLGDPCLAEGETQGPVLFARCEVR